MRDSGPVDGKTGMAGARGRRRSRPPARDGWGAGPAASATVALLALAGWAALVRLAIGLGRDARDGGGGPDWALMALSGAAAAGCLLVAFALLARVRELVVRRRALRRRPAGRHRR